MTRKREKILVTEYWNPCVDNPSGWPFPTKVCTGIYVVKSRQIVDNTLRDIWRRWRRVQSPVFPGQKRRVFGKDYLLEDNGTWYGIHSYTKIERVFS